MLLLSLAFMLMMTTGVSAATNYTLFYDSGTGQMYTEIDANNNGTTVYSGQTDKWSSAYSNSTSNYVLTLKGFSFTTSSNTGLVLLKDTTICLAQGTTNTITSTYHGNDYDSSAIVAAHDLTIYGNGSGSGKLIAQGGTSNNGNDCYSDGIFCAATLSVQSGSIESYGGADAESSGIDAYTFQYFSGDVVAKGGYSLYFLSDGSMQVISYMQGALFFGGNSASSASKLTVANNSTNDTLFDAYPYLHIYSTLSDVPYTSWYYQNINTAYGNGILKGTANSDGVSFSMRPESSITRAEFVTMLARIFLSEDELNDYAGMYTFKDIPAWADKYVGWGTKMAYVGGYSADWFGANDNITRQDMVTILYRIVKDETSNTPKTSITFTDAAAIADYATTAVSAMQQAGVIGGTKNSDGTTYSFFPTNNATRAEAATMLLNFIAAYAK